MPAQDNFLLLYRINKFVVIFLLLFLSVIITTLFVSQRNPLSLSSYIVTSGSMEPYIPKGSVIYTQRQTHYDVSDVVTFSNSSGLITHRIIGQEEVGGVNYFVTKGDSNEIPDSFYTYEETIIGRTIAVIPFLGLLLESIKERSGFMIFVLIPSLFIIGSFCKNIFLTAFAKSI